LESVVLLVVDDIVEALFETVVSGDIEGVVVGVKLFALILFSCLFLIFDFDVDVWIEVDMDSDEWDLLKLESTEDGEVVDVTIGEEFDKDNEDNVVCVEGIFFVGVEVVFIFKDEIVVATGIGIEVLDDTGDAVVETLEDGTSEEDERFDIEFLFVTVVDNPGREELFNFSAIDFVEAVDIKFAESVNKNGNKDEGNIEGTFKFGLLFKVVEIDNDGIVVVNGKLVNGAIGFGTIFAAAEVFNVVAVVDEDGVDVEDVEEVEILFEFIVFFVIGIVDADGDDDDDKDFVDDINDVLGDGFGEGFVDKIGVDFCDLIVDFFDEVEIGEDDDNVEVNTDEFEVADVIDICFNKCSLPDPDVVGAIENNGRELNDDKVGMDENVDDKEWLVFLLSNNEADVSNAGVINDFGNDGEETGEEFLMLLLIDFVEILFVDDIDDEVLVTFEIDDNSVFGKILFISFDISLERRLFLFLFFDDNNEDVFFWIGLFIILFNNGCDFIVANFGLSIFSGIVVEDEFLANEEKDNFDISEIGNNSFVWSFGSLINSEINGEFTTGLSIKIFDEMSSSINWSFTLFIMSLLVFVNFGDGINIFKNSSSEL